MNFFTYQNLIDELKATNLPTYLGTSGPKKTTGLEAPVAAYYFFFMHKIPGCDIRNRENMRIFVDLGTYL